MAGGRQSPPPILAGGAVGEVRNISQGTIHYNNGSTTVVTFRLERHDPSAGRTSVVTARLKGSRAIGFASEGDWVEVLGPSSQGFINVRRAINRTSNAEYQASGRGLSRRVQTAIGLVFFCFVLALVIANFLGG